MMVNNIEDTVEIPPVMSFKRKWRAQYVVGVFQKLYVWNQLELSEILSSKHWENAY